MEGDLLSVIEAVFARHTYVAECAVIGVYDSVKGQVPIAIIVPKASIDRSLETIKMELLDAVNKELAPVVSIRNLCIVPEVPRNGTGNISKGIIINIAEGMDIGYTGDIKNPTSLDSIRTALRDIGYARRSSEFFVGCGRVCEANEPRY